MKIYADSFKKWKKILEIYRDKGNPIGESIYLNFEESYAYFGSKDGAGRMKFYYAQEYWEEKFHNVFLPTEKFLNVITLYDEMNVSPSFVFTNNKDRYRIATIQDDDKIDCELISKTTFSSVIEITKDDMDTLDTALAYVNKDERNINFRNLFLQEGVVGSLTS